MKAKEKVDKILKWEARRDKINKLLCQHPDNKLRVELENIAGKYIKRLTGDNGAYDDVSISFNDESFDIQYEDRYESYLYLDNVPYSFFDDPEGYVKKINEKTEEASKLKEDREEFEQYKRLKEKYEKNT